MATKRDYYEILGVQRSATLEEIKRAYRKLALKFHPDKNKEPGAEDTFKEINEAYEILADEQKRKSYDQFGHAAFDGAAGMGGNPFGGGFRQGGPFSYTYSTSGENPFGAGAEGFSDPFDIFEQFFGGGFRGGAGFQAKPRYTLRVSFLDAALGAEKKVSIDGKERTIKVPAGADDGTRMRFPDFDITFDVLPHERFRREGYDLYIDQVIPFTTAALGGKVEVETLTGSIQLKVRAGTQSNTLVRLRSEGVQHLQRSGKGDLYVRFLIEVPEKLTKQQKKLLEEFAKLA